MDRFFVFVQKPEVFLPEPSDRFDVTLQWAVPVVRCENAEDTGGTWPALATADSAVESCLGRTGGGAGT
jgi:hypothetical protein